MLDFGVNLRNYKSRLDFHKKESQKYRDTSDALSQQSSISKPAQAVLHFVRFEAEYNTKLAAKYQHFLSFVPATDEDQEDFDKLLAYREKLDNLNRLREDRSMRRMRPKAAEEYGQKVYDMHGGRFMAIAPEFLSIRAGLMQKKYDGMRKAFMDRLFDKGMTLEVDPRTGEMSMASGTLYDFEDVKALDIHHMGYDFSRRVPVSDKYARQFVQTAEIRSELYNRAKDYLVNTNQGAFLSLFPEKDIRLMKDVADRLKTVRHIEAATERPALGPGGKPVQESVVKTLPLGKSCRQCQFDIDLAIRSTVQSTADFMQPGE